MRSSSLSCSMAATCRALYGEMVDWMNHQNARILRTLLNMLTLFKAPTLTRTSAPRSCEIAYEHAEKIVGLVLQVQDNRREEIEIDRYRGRGVV